MKRYFLLVAAVAAAATIIAGCGGKATTKYNQYANPFVGAADNGHCNPGATVPFGNIQVGPQTGNFTWAYTSGYQNRDRSIMGFSHNRLSGTGCHDLGDVLLMPFTGNYTATAIVMQPGAKIPVPAKEDFSSPFSKDNETAEPGYYSVKLDAYDIIASMSATEHAAIHNYTYNGSDKPRLLLDFQSAMVSGINQFHNHVLESIQAFENDHVISGMCRTRVWLDRTYYYVIEFDRPYTAATELEKRDPREKAPRYVLDFDLNLQRILMVHAVYDQHVVRCRLIHFQKRSFHLGREDVDTADDEHIIAPALKARDPGSRSAAFALRSVYAC